MALFSSALNPTPPNHCIPKTISTTNLRRTKATIRCSLPSSTTPTATNRSSPAIKFDLKTYWTTLIKDINKNLDEAIPAMYPDRIYEAMRYSVLAEGAKRAPPVMCVAAYELFGGNRLAAFPTACALEMVHAASLIHDDLPCMDDDPSRRGQPSNHTIYGVDMAILAGDALFPLGFRHIVSHTPSDLVPETRLLRVIAEIAQTVRSTGMAAGQFLDLDGVPNSIEFVQEKKFGKMSECSAVCGGILAGANDDEIENLRQYGRAVGVLYQVVDNILKAKSTSEEQEDYNEKKGHKKKAKNYVAVYGIEKALEAAEDLRAKAKRELDELVLRVSSFFFKQAWSVVGEEVCEAVKEFFRNSMLLKQMNHTALALIPKTSHDPKVSDYRPIACCNVVYKIISNRLTPILGYLVNEAQGAFVPGMVEIHQFLDRFYMSRIGIRMLTGQHVALHEPNPPPDIVGYIHTKMSPLEIARNASEDARSICSREYGSAPDVNIYGDPNFTFPYVPLHLHLMVFELVKNSLRAVQERFMDSDKVSPPIRIVVADGEEDVTIKISDEGGGIARSGLPKIFTYLYSTAKNPLNEDLANADMMTMAGYGYGLPISRLYARYFGGDMQIISMEGYGTDAYLHLSRLGDSQEPLH